MKDTISYIITVILFINGVYDIACSASILWLSNIPGFKQLSLLHPTMYSSPKNSENDVSNK
jgi:hypothetical protein